MTFEVGLAVIAGLLALWGIVICATGKDLDWLERRPKGSGSEAARVSRSGGGLRVPTSPQSGPGPSWDQAHVAGSSPADAHPLTAQERLYIAIQRQAEEREQRVWTAMQQPTHLKRVK